VQVSRDVDDKASAAELHNLLLFKDGGFIGPCGRWQWTNGKLRRNGAVVWDRCCMPADPQHFFHDKARASVFAFWVAILLLKYLHRFAALYWLHFHVWAPIVAGGCTTLHAEL